MGMKTHIEYDDFGEYIEVLEEDTMLLVPDGGCTDEGSFFTGARIA